MEQVITILERTDEEQAAKEQAKQDELILEKYKAAFALLPEEHDRDYEKSIVKLSQAHEQDVVQRVLSGFLESQAEEPLRYAAYCTLHSLHRRMRDKEKLRVLRAKYENVFDRHPSALHFRLLSYVDLGEVIDGEAVLLQAKKSVEKMQGSAGAEHLLADLVVRYFREDPRRAKGQQADMWVEEGLSAVERAIAAEKYAKFYYTKARLLTLKGRYKEALADLQTAQDREDSRRTDYVLRMATYLAEINRIEDLQRSSQMEEELARHASELAQKQEAAEARIKAQMIRLDESSVKNLEFLGLFAGVISFTIGGISIVSNASDFSFLGAAGLLVVLMGTLLEVFCGFGVILHGLGQEDGNWRRNLAVCVFGVIMIAAGLYLCGNAGVMPGAGT